MAFVRGLSQYFVFNAIDLTANLASEVKLSIAGQEINASTIGNNWQRMLQGQASGQFTVSGVWDSGTASTNLDNTLYSALAGGGKKKFQYSAAGSAAATAGYDNYHGLGIVTGYEIGGPVGDKIPFSVAIRIATIGQVLTTEAGDPLATEAGEQLAIEIN